ncbi:HNH endonuclease [Francisella philomiragia]|uniref:HNH endonuclease family protein n=1 Tax=Francisella philomiragia TaxID=28110 RepID=A0A0B6CXH0_9GAMM|nr:HNH endonuclease signature motif containing protein [Francisella philomiragia]AJI53540.1 HNH endonuclease family protein [Francisella philomiragia]
MKKPIHRIKPKHRANVRKEKYSKYKSILAQDFHKACGYCGLPDFQFGGTSGFHIDHFAPKKKFPELEDTYTNLIYSCPSCNRRKSDFWPTSDPKKPILNSQGFFNPCEEEFDYHLYRTDDGKIKSETDIGKFIIQRLHLFLRKHEIIWLREEYKLLIEQLKKSNICDKDQLMKYLDKYLEYSDLIEKNMD